MRTIGNQIQGSPLCGNSILSNSWLISIDLCGAENHAWIRPFFSSVDAAIENARCNRVAAWRLCWEDLTRTNPALGMVRIDRFRKNGQYRARPECRVTGEAVGALRYMTGDQATARDIYLTVKPGVYMALQPRLHKMAVIAVASKHRQTVCAIASKPDKQGRRVTGRHPQEDRLLHPDLRFAQHFAGSANRRAEPCHSTGCRTQVLKTQGSRVRQGYSTFPSAKNLQIPVHHPSLRG